MNKEPIYRFVKASENPKKDGKYVFVEDDTTTHGLWFYADTAPNWFYDSACYDAVEADVINGGKWLFEEPEEEPQWIHKFKDEKEFLQFLKWERLQKDLVASVSADKEASVVSHSSGFGNSIQQLQAALKQAVSVIEQWHGKEVFDIYYNRAPEMKLIREALQSKQPEGESIEVYVPCEVEEVSKNGEFLVATGKATVTDEKAKLEFIHQHLKKIKVPASCIEKDLDSSDPRDMGLDDDWVHDIDMGSR